MFIIQWQNAQCFFKYLMSSFPVNSVCRNNSCYTGNFNTWNLIFSYSICSIYFLAIFPFDLKTIRAYTYASLVCLCDGDGYTVVMCAVQSHAVKIIMHLRHRLTVCNSLETNIHTPKNDLGCRWCSVAWLLALWRNMVEHCLW